MVMRPSLAASRSSLVGSSAFITGGGGGVRLPLVSSDLRNLYHGGGSELSWPSSASSVVRLLMSSARAEMYYSSSTFSPLKGGISVLSTRGMTHLNRDGFARVERRFFSRGSQKEVESSSEENETATKQEDEEDPDLRLLESVLIEHAIKLRYDTKCCHNTAIPTPLSLSLSRLERVQSPSNRC